MHDVHHEHAHSDEEKAKNVSDLDKLRRMVEHWIAHNEEHASSYRLWANRAREARRNEPGKLLDEIAEEVSEQSKKLKQIMELLERE